MSPEELFKEAAKQWDLERLYKDLADTKDSMKPNGRYGLTAGEKTRLRGLLLKKSPAEIADEEVIETKTVEVALCQSLYRYIESLTGHDRNSIENWRDIESWLAAAGYRRVRVAINWKQMPQVPVLYGRQDEINQLKEWILHDGACRLIVINGPAGMGKTSLAIKLSKELKSEFEGFIWQSLRHKPTFKSVISYWWNQLPERTETAIEEYFALLDRFMNYLRSHRCLIVLDNLETILLGGSLLGEYEPGYEDYAELLKRLSEEFHQSCIIITSRENNAETRGFSSAFSSIRNLALEGLSYDAAERVLIEEGISIQEQSKRLINQYRGNPLILRIVAKTIQELFDGDVPYFLKQRKTLFGDIEYLIAQQCKRLSEEEKAILIQLAQRAEPMQIDCFEQPYSLQAINALAGRSLVEKSRAGFTLRPAVMEYVYRYLL